MKLQYSISFLMFTTLAVAMLITLSRPFDPNVAFETTIVPNAIRSETNQCSIAYVWVYNNSSYPIWYFGSGNRITSYFMASGEEGGRLYGRSAPRSDTHATWVKLDAGGKAHAQFPVGDTSNQIFFEVELQDWRGRTVSRSNGSDENVVVLIGHWQHDEEL